MTASRIRKIGSVKSELIKKSREAALTAVQVFNNPNIFFKAESYVVLMNIAWTYLMHAYYRDNYIEYRYFKMAGSKRLFDKTKHGAYKYWELERCLNDKNSPLDADTTNNLRFIIGLRHEIEHQMTTRIDDLLSARFQACCLNYNEYLKKLFGDNLGIERHLSFSLQFSTISEEQKDSLAEQKGLPANIHSYIQDFDAALSETAFGSPRYAYRILFVRKLANRKGQADRVIEFVPSDSPLSEGINKEYALIKETEKPKYLPGQIVSLMSSEGFAGFTMHHHTRLWKQHDAKNPAKGYGAKVADKHWHFYENWVAVVRAHCNDSGDFYRSESPKRR